MNGLTIRISRRSHEEPHGLDIGDLELEGELGRSSSRGRSPDRGMMIYVSIVGLLDSAKRLVQNPRVKVIDFVGADSSFPIVFRRTSSGSVRVWSCGDIAEVADRAVLRAVTDAVRTFLSGGNGLVETDAVWADLEAAMRGATDAADRPM